MLANNMIKGFEFTKYTQNKRVDTFVKDASKIVVGRGPAAVTVWDDVANTFKAHVDAPKLRPENFGAGNMTIQSYNFYLAGNIILY